MNRRRQLAALFACVVAIALAGCGALPQRPDPAYSTALPPSPESPLVRTVQASLPAPDLTGFRLMPLGAYSLDARIQLARRARYSLDVQYYLIQNDRTGRLLLRNLRDAALRGVRVRVLVDDLYTSGGDPLFIGLTAFPNVEVRLFNPFCCGRDSLDEQVRRVARRLRAAQPPDAQQAVHRRRRRSSSRAGATSPTNTSCAARPTISSTWTRSWWAPSCRSSPASSTSTGTVRRFIRRRRSSARASIAKQLQRQVQRARRRRRADDGGQRRRRSTSSDTARSAMISRRAASASSGARPTPMPTARQGDWRPRTRWRDR